MEAQWKLSRVEPILEGSVVGEQTAVKVQKWRLCGSFVLEFLLPMVQKRAEVPCWRRRGGRAVVKARLCFSSKCLAPRALKDKRNAVRKVH